MLAAEEKSFGHFFSNQAITRNPGASIRIYVLFVDRRSIHLTASSSRDERFVSDDAVRNQCVGHFDKARQVSALDVVNPVAFATVLAAFFVNAAHDVLQAAIDLFCGPR